MTLLFASNGEETALFVCVLAGSLAVEQVIGASSPTMPRMDFMNSMVAALPADGTIVISSPQAGKGFDMAFASPWRPFFVFHMTSH